MDSGDLQGKAATEMSIFTTYIYIYKYVYISMYVHICRATATCLKLRTKIRHLGSELFVFMA